MPFGLRGAASDLEGIARRRMGSVGSRTQEQARGSGDGEFHTFRVFDEFEDVGLSDLEEGRWVVTNELTVDPQVGYVWGYAEPNTPNQGRIYGDIRDSDGDGDNPVPVKVQLYSDNARQNAPEGHGSWDGDELNQTKSRRDSWVPLPERDMPMIREDSRLKVRMMALEENPNSIDEGNSTLIVNATEFENP